MGTILQFPSGKAAYDRKKKARLTRQKETMEAIFKQSYDTWALSLFQKWPNGLPLLVLSDERLTDALFAEYSALIYTALNEMDVMCSPERFKEITNSVYTIVSEEHLKTYAQQVERFIETLETLSGEKRVVARILNPIVYEKSPEWTDGDEEYEWMVASDDWTPYGKNNHEFLAFIACGLHLEGVVTVHQKTGMSYQVNNKWVDQERVYGFALYQGFFNKMPSNHVKDIYTSDGLLTEAGVIPKNVIFSECNVVIRE